MIQIKNGSSKFLPLALMIAMSFLYQSQAPAMVIEVGLNYGYNKKTFDANNYYQMDSKTASLAFYFSEWLALETSYTDAFVEQQQKDSNTRVIQQSTKVIGADLMVLFADRNALLQPYIKGGAAKITKNQTTKVDNFQTYTVSTPDSLVPSYGGGLKIKLTEQFYLKFGVDYWKTPLEGGGSSEDSAFKAGLSWML